MIALASGQSYEMMPGHYMVKAEATDTEESYPVDISLTIDELGKLQEGSINYPTYDCIASIIEAKQTDYQIIFKEKMSFGYDTCEASDYFVKINANKLFSPHLKGYIHIHTYDEGQEVKIKIDRFNFNPTKTATYRIQEKASTINDLFSTTNSIILRHLSKSSSHKFIKDKAKGSLAALVMRENSEFKKIIETGPRKALTDYITTFPGSPHLATVRTKIQIIDYRNQGTPEGFYAAYLLSSDNRDIVSLLGCIKTLKGLFLFVDDKSELRKHELVKNQIADFYRRKNSFEGYMNAFRELGLDHDLMAANEKVLNSSTKISIKANSLNLFCKNVVRNLSHVDQFTAFINKTNYATSSDRYNCVISQKWFGKSLTPQSFLSSAEYAKVLRHLRPVIDIEHGRETARLRIKYPEKTFTFNFNVTCQYHSQYTQIEDTGFFADFLAPYTKKRVSYRRDECKITPADFRQIVTLEHGILGRSSLLNIGWRVNHYLSKEYIESSKTVGVASDTSSVGHNSDIQPPPSSSGSNTRHKGSTQNSGGVKKYYDGGYKTSDGHRIYIIICNGGSKYSVFQKSNGYWFDSDGFNYGDRARNLSIRDFAEKKCSN